MILKKVRIIVCFRGLKKSKILIAILDFLSTLKRTSISAFVSLLFINGISYEDLVLTMLIKFGLQTSPTSRLQVEWSIWQPLLIGIQKLSITQNIQYYGQPTGHERTQ